MTDRSSTGVNSVRTAFEVLEAVGTLQPIGLSELSRRLATPKTTVQRSLATLAELGWIRPDRRDRTRWVLGEAVRTLAQHVAADARLRKAALPVLGELNADTLETVHLSRADGDELELVERMDSAHPLRYVLPIGSRGPLHASASGKAVLAALPDAEVERYLADGLRRLAANTITDPGPLRAQLRRIRRRGWSSAEEELSDGIASVAACIRSAGGRPVAALSISGPTARITARVRPHYGELVRDAAARVATQLR
ncbi:IclR family transcriptional regulator [Streptomyces sp. NPDC101225]|uniref:IclR family transcriptional regulator n=1 Tax=Streptomyces sp. NPDC101225 TaxID=3366135 RepID=UPI0038240B9B